MDRSASAGFGDRSNTDSPSDRLFRTELGKVAETLSIDNELFRRVEL